MAKKPLVRVELEPGRFVKMYRDDVQRLGLIGPAKVQEAVEDKMRRPAEDKTIPESHSGPDMDETSDDLTEIPGVGPATAERLRAQGLETLEELRTVDLSALDGRARRAIERWRDE